MVFVNEDVSHQVREFNCPFQLTTSRFNMEDSIMDAGTLVTD